MLVICKIITLNILKNMWAKLSRVKKEPLKSLIIIKNKMSLVKVLMEKYIKLEFKRKELIKYSQEKKWVIMI